MMGKHGEDQDGWGVGGGGCGRTYPGPSQDLYTQLAVTTALQFR